MYDRDLEQVLAPFRKARRVLVALNLPFSKSRAEIEEEIKSRVNGFHSLIWPPASKPSFEAPRHAGQVFIIFQERRWTYAAYESLQEFTYGDRSVKIKMATKTASSPDPTGERRQADPSYAAQLARSNAASSTTVAGPSTIATSFTATPTTNAFAPFTALSPTVASSLVAPTQSMSLNTVPSTVAAATSNITALFGQLQTALAQEVSNITKSFEELVRQQQTTIQEQSDRIRQQNDRIRELESLLASSPDQQGAPSTSVDETMAGV
ncbi:hypothetical protein ACHAQA_009566 [Verticillium albo-atrum]